MYNTENIEYNNSGNYENPDSPNPKPLSSITKNRVSNPINPSNFSAGSFVNGFIQSANFLTGSSGWQINANGNVEFNNGTFRGTLTGGTLQTTPVSGASVNITQNKINLYDNTTESGGVISGSTSAINFLRSYDTSKGFIIQQRASTINTDDNVLEIFSNPPATGHNNYMFVGRQGDNTSYNLGYFEISSNINTSLSAAVANGTITANLATNGVEAVSSHLVIQDVRWALSSSGLSGVVSYLMGTGTNGFSGLGYNGGISLLVNSTGIVLSNNMIPDTSKAYNIGSAAFPVNTTFSNIVLNSASADPSGTNGMMYYNSSTGHIRAFVGGSWVTVV